MIPKHISLKNFLSYREASLDFSGLHVVCVAGPNGAGKSSLLEAIAWALWGQSRAAADDDIIHQGALEASVSFQFQQGDHTYRVIRSRHRSQGTSLEFQVYTEAGWRVLTQRGVRATQALLCRHLRLDLACTVVNYPLPVVRNVLIPESLPALVLGLTLMVISLIGNSAMAGVVGGGGLGDLAIRYGFQRFDTRVMLFTVVISRVCMSAGSLSS
ncbi:AAA family ATPase [Leptolyngbya sp. KIOST-1]|uniref:AAA family ATPase n=1 Tax=Leptolyngbya sp. KIOST-1 TaxID=1229172 RepID=UPI000567594B|nr:AAA family ATPase [Leptolyngbya sp. KIOST-1]